MDLANLREVVVSNVVPLALHIVGAIVLWVAGRFVIGLIGRGMRAAGTARKIDPTLVRYVDSATHILLSVLLLLAVLSIFGIETTSFAGVIAAAGVAIGMALS